MAAIAIDERLAGILASDAQAIADPFPVWSELVRLGPARRFGPVLFVSRYEDVKELSKDGVRLSNRAQFEGSRVDALMERLTPEQVAAHQEISSFEQNFMARSDGELHDRLRKIAHLAFTPRRVAEIAATVQRYTDELLDRMLAAGDTDLMAGLAYALPLMVIAEMLEVPEAEREPVHGWSNLIARNRGGDDPAALMEAHRALREFRAYVAEHVAAKRRNPGTDLVSALMEAHDGERLSEEELQAMFVNLLFAGHETTTNLIAHGVVAMHRNPDQWQLLCAEPGLAEAGVEELLRWVTPVQFSGRVAVAPLRIDAEEVAPGDTVFLMLAAANRDPAVFAEPNRLDLRRDNARAHMSLGFGPHYCLGNALARLEAQIAFETLARRFPTIEVETEELRYRGHWKLRSLVELPVRLEPGR